MKIPLSRAHIPQKAFENINYVLSSGNLSGDGLFCRKVEKKFCDILSVKHALLTSSCTHALEISTLLLDAKEGDEVILPSFTFTSTANAILVAGLKPVFCEIDPLTMNMDMEDVASKMTDKTKAIIPVHYAGVACAMDKLEDLCQSKNIIIIEDAAHSIGAKWRGRNLGTIGDMAALSFHETKNVICGEGGALLTNNDFLANKAQIIREKGTNRSQFLKGQVDKYTWIEKGSSYILAEPLAAILDAEIDIMNELNKKREVIYKFYMKELKELADKEIINLPYIPNDCESNYHLFHLIARNENLRNSLISHLRSKNIGATFHYIPLHSAPAGLKLGNKLTDLPLTEEYSQRLLRLPLYPDLNENEMQYIIEEIYNWSKFL
ncbi:dTDP-4-amino-4,6-dideoxygalactose transaminase [Fluviispira multicolorata]|uniref:dTDP-4-amino-4,6-dideoxygalactose transaminase n=1 Tax=Fluviispira multicolorata TaxID=2654512 RepID=A0A833JEK1_9BACT|nr:dTDP-4-amino-4,6-dideoxygalactose transaminase [Fluviispira multicolorata]KAB8029934.1 dTDP-4-amino-4,6-dideoxygalactose transaminase [Fluviispira multicolorata]